MHYVTGHPVISGEIVWQYFPSSTRDSDDGIRVGFHLAKAYNRRKALKIVEDYVTRNKVRWISPTPKDWIFNLDKLHEDIGNYKQLGWMRPVFKINQEIKTEDVETEDIETFQRLDWMRGKLKIEPNIENENREVFGKVQQETSVAFYIDPKDLEVQRMVEYTPPVEIRESLERFHADFPDGTKTAFIMMQFGTTKAHEAIVKGIRNVLKPLGIDALRADDKHYHDDLFPNVLTYLWGCSFGVAVFERIQADEFNPNVSLEVGYMLAMKKPVCLLKDQTLKTLQTDLVGKLYRTFDPQDPVNSIAPELTQWLKDKGMLKK
jgi:hypothetical protein